MGNINCAIAYNRVMHWMGVLPLCPIVGSSRRAMTEIQTVQISK
ncbi:hypothetical protein [Synechocystis sp. PCC 7509]|nr:hypothetical protein [Synechocystis sp. PCC 7509]